jgi:hypothetical protein
VSGNHSGEWRIRASASCSGRLLTRVLFDHLTELGTSRLAAG